MNMERLFNSPLEEGYVSIDGLNPVEEAKKMKCYRRLIYKQFVPVSGLCGPQFLSYLPKRFTQLCRALYGDAILGVPNQQKLFLFTQELAYVRINISPNT